jgi:hypothetical protein
MAFLDQSHQQVINRLANCFSILQIASFFRKLLSDDLRKIFRRVVSMLKRTILSTQLIMYSCYYMPKLPEPHFFFSKILKLLLNCSYCSLQKETIASFSLLPFFRSDPLCTAKDNRHRNWC